MNFIKINNVTTHYNYVKSTSASAEATTIVFINSLGTDFRIWDDVVEFLTGQYNILRYDKRGHGLSEMVEHSEELNDYMKDLSALLEDLSIEKCSVIGLSVGGMIAQLLAFHNPEKINSLILCDTCFKIGNEQSWNERIAAIGEGGLQTISGSVMEKWFSKNFRMSEPEKVCGYQNMLERTPLPGYIQTCKAIRDADLGNIAAQIQVPVLCIVGAEDRSTTTEEVRSLADLIKGSAYEIIPDSGHLPCVDNPKTFSKLILEFIK